MCVCVCVCAGVQYAYTNIVSVVCTLIYKYTSNVECAYIWYIRLSDAACVVTTVNSGPRAFCSVWSSNTLWTDSR